MIRVQSQDMKIKFLIKDPSLTFRLLKPLLIAKFQKMGQTIEESQVTLADETDFVLMSDDECGDFLHSNEMVKLILKK